MLIRVKMIAGIDMPPLQRQHLRRSFYTTFLQATSSHATGFRDTPIKSVTSGDIITFPLALR